LIENILVYYFLKTIKYINYNIFYRNWFTEYRRCIITYWSKHKRIGLKTFVEKLATNTIHLKILKINLQLICKIKHFSPPVWSRPDELVGLIKLNHTKRKFLFVAFVSIYKLRNPICNYFQLICKKYWHRFEVNRTSWWGSLHYRPLSTG